MERYQNRGNLDHSRLYKLGTSQLINRRWNEEDVNDYHGRPLVVITKDGSSSNTVETTFAGQILTAAFLRTRHMARIDIIAADYSSDRSGPLVQWLYHPGKIRYAGLYDAAALVASLAPKGQGGNNDVLSISYILQESLDVRKREQFIHVINVTDGKFNSPISEVKSMVKKLREDYGLTYSFIVLGGFKVDVPEADYTISIPATELAKPVSIAERIAQHVNQLVCNKRAKRRFFYGQT